MVEIRFDRSVCGNAEESLRREWLETNGLGGYASSTITGANTRRYHGLLVAGVDGPGVRRVLLSKLEETLIVGDQRFDLSTNLYPGAMHPEGLRYLAGFRMDPFPVFTFEAAGVTIEKRVFLVEGENTVVVEYESDSACRLELRPLVAFRGYHDLTRANTALNGALQEMAGGFSIQPYPELPRLSVAHNARSLKRRGNWYYNFEYARERERGLDFQEDLFCPCVLSYELAAGAPGFVIASTVTHQADEAAALKARETGRNRNAAGQFLVCRGARQTIVAGYPWFEDWSRDTMIALPGLTLATGRFDMAREILLAAAGDLDRGVLPNHFDEGDRAPAYNTADATLWLFEALRQYIEYTGDAEFVRTRFYETLKDIVSWHVQGTRCGIYMDVDGLLATGDLETQLTWMDARVNGKPVTPRNGKPVEIQALWYNALRFTARLAGDFGDEEGRVFHEDLAARVEQSFNGAFWNEDAGCLFDVIDGERRHAELRPNQVIALSLGYCMVAEERARRVLSVVERALLTPYGLRTLAAEDPAYRGRYEGPPEVRDAAYHQGTVWPWLLGPFIAADVRFNSVRFNGDPARGRIGALLAPLRAFAETCGVGQIPEIFDGDAPHEPRGCIAQAWSVGEILRAGRL